MSPECSGEAVAKAVYGVIGVGVFVALKYCYPSVKKFFQKHLGLKSDQNDDEFIDNFCNLSPLPNGLTTSLGLTLSTVFYSSS